MTMIMLHILCHFVFSRQARARDVIAAVRALSLIKHFTDSGDVGDSRRVFGLCKLTEQTELRIVANETRFTRYRVATRYY
jgi:hypothetical protein